MNLVAKGVKVRGAGLLGWGSQEGRWGAMHRLQAGQGGVPGGVQGKHPGQGRGRLSGMACCGHRKRQQPPPSVVRKEAGEGWEDHPAGPAPDVCTASGC